MPVAVEVNIRPVEPADIEAVQALWDETGVGRAAPDEIAALISGDTAAVLVADRGGQVIGTAIASFDGWRAYIYHVAVSASARGQGIAYRLMDRAEQYLISAGARYVYVMVHQDNTDGLALAASAGYLPEPETVLVKRMATRPA